MINIYSKQIDNLSLPDNAMKQIDKVSLLDNTVKQIDNVSLLDDTMKLIDNLSLLSLDDNMNLPKTAVLPNVQYQQLERYCY